MAITEIRIHPTIGIARVGNCPDEFYIGPELPGIPEPPAGGYKDAACRVKRQAARFRLWAYDGDTPLQEVVAAPNVKIQWTAQIANLKASQPKFKQAGLRNPAVVAAADREKLDIKPSARSVQGANDQAFFDDGKIEFPGAPAKNVALGELRTDDQGRLLVLGGKGESASPTGAGFIHFANNDGWYDDVGDGWVKAEVEIDGQVFQAAPSWVVIGPPRFAPGIEQVTTLWDVAFELARSEGWLAVPANPSLRDEIYPILRRADRARWVNSKADAHGGWSEIYPMDASLRGAIFDKMRDPDNPNVGWPATMPYLQRIPGFYDLTVTRAQYAMLEAWSNGSFDDDMGDPPPVLSPALLDRVALDNTVGAAFYPGIEASEALTNPAIWEQPFRFRLDPDQLQPGALTAGMALPWQSDFLACDDEWWPSHRPNHIRPQSAPGSALAWTRGIGNQSAMVAGWHTLGFVVHQDGKFLEVERCDTPYVALLTPALDFRDVPQGPGGMARQLALAVTFEVLSAMDVTLEITNPVHPQLSTPLGTSVLVKGGATVQTARLWVLYTTGNIGDSLATSVTAKQQGTAQTWKVPITANTVGRKKSVIGLALDRSGSMVENRGDGKQKIESLRETGKIFVDLMLQDDALVISRFNEDSQLILAQTVLGDPGNAMDPGRKAAKDIFDAGSAQLAPNGFTSIGDGIHVARQELDVAAGFDTKALIALTDGKENRDLKLADVGSDINATTFAIGFGQPQNISVSGLQKIAGNHSGYLLVTGAITPQNEFLLSKFFLQILAGVTNAEVVVDPQDVLQRGGFHRLPFEVCEGDNGLDVIVLSPDPKAIDFRLETPLGTVIDPAIAAADGTVDHFERDGVAFYRLSLPQYSTGRRAGEGLWHAQLRYRGDGRSVPYSFLVHAYSEVRLKAAVFQRSYEPWSAVEMSATLDQFGIPLRSRARVWATITLPDGSTDRVELDRRVSESTYLGRFETRQPGVYQVRIQAMGESLRGFPFRRERTLSVQVWEGGDSDDGWGDDQQDIPRDRRHRRDGLLAAEAASIGLNEGRGGLRLTREEIATLRRLLDRLERGG